MCMYCVLCYFGASAQTIRNTDQRFRIYNVHIWELAAKVDLSMDLHVDFKLTCNKNSKKRNPWQSTKNAISMVLIFRFFMCVCVVFCRTSTFLSLRSLFGKRKKSCWKIETILHWKPKWRKSQRNNNVCIGIFFCIGYGKELIKVRSIVFISCKMVASWKREK